MKCFVIPQSECVAIVINAYYSSVLIVIFIYSTLQNNQEHLSRDPPPYEDPNPEAQQPLPPPIVEEDYSGKEFPIKVLGTLDEQLNRPKWVVPVRPGDELEKLLKFSIVMCREGKPSHILYIWHWLSTLPSCCMFMYISYCV